MNWTMPYPWRARSDSVRRINMSSEPGKESFFCAFRPIPRILSLRRRYCASQVQVRESSPQDDFLGAHGRRMRIAFKVALGHQVKAFEKDRNSQQSARTF